MKRLRVTVEGKTYEVEVELIEDDESENFFPTTNITPIAQNNNNIVQPIKKVAPTISDGSGEITAPMAGNITLISLKVGDNVNIGDKVAEMEAMKMITPLTATASGKITEIKVSIGDNVNQGAVIAIIG